MLPKIKTFYTVVALSVHTWHTITICETFDKKHAYRTLQRAKVNPAHFDAKVVRTKRLYHNENN